MLERKKARKPAGRSWIRFPPAASVVSADRIVFNIRGNDQRLVVAVDFEKGIVWIKHVHFGERLSHMTGLPYYGPMGRTPSGESIVNVKPGRAILASVDANKAGRNLQMFSKNLVTSISSNALENEQLENLGVAEKVGGSAWVLAEDWQSRLRELGERGDILKQVHRALCADDGARLHVVPRGLGLPDGRGGMDERTLVGPLVDADAVAEMQRALARANAEGGTILVGGAPLDRKGGCYAAPCVVAAKPDMQIVRDETSIRASVRRIIPTVSRTNQ